MSCGKTESSGVKMSRLLNQIKKILKESNGLPERTPATIKLQQDSKKIQKQVDDDGLKSKKPKKLSDRDKEARKKAKNKETDEEADILNMSKKDLEDKEGSEEKSSDKEEVKDEKVKTPDESPSTINLADALKFEELIDILNQFRAAHSFTDKEVYGRLKAYFQKLEDAEKKVLHIFIKGLIQTTMLKVDGASAYAPSDLMFNITKTGSASSEKRRSQARKIDAKEKAKTSDTPIITVGGPQKKESIEEAFKINMD